jgi:ABC-type sugar transport system ATPase subunit
MNFIDGELRGEGDGLTFEAPAVRLGLKPRSVTPCRATLGIRPEHVRLTRDGPGPSAKVSLTEPMGDETLVFLDYGGPESLVAKVDGEEKVAVGDRRGFSFRGDRIVFFDTATGDRILR